MTTVHNTVGEMTSDELERLIKSCVASGLRDVGIYVESPEHVDDMRTDLRFLRRLRSGFDGMAIRVGSIVILGICGAIGVLLALGFRSWIGAR